MSVLGMVCVGLGLLVFTLAGMLWIEMTESRLLRSRLREMMDEELRRMVSVQHTPHLSIDQMRAMANPSALRGPGVLGARNITPEDQA